MVLPREDSLDPNPGLLVLNVLQSAQPARFPDLISTYFYLSIDHPFAAPALTAFDLHQLGWMKPAQALPVQTDKS